MMGGEIRDVQLLKQADATKLDPTGFPNRTDATISFVDGTRTFSITPVASTFTFWIKGVEYEREAESVVITDTEGVWFIYYNDSAVLTASQTPWAINETVQIAVIYWDATNNKAIVFAEERHDMSMSGVTHEYLHETIGARFQNGLSLTATLGDGSLAAHAQVAIADGTIFDEDLEINIVDDPTPSATFEQILDPIAELPVYYKDGAGGPWRKKDADTYPVLFGSSRITYNLDTAGTWSQPDVTNNYHMAMWVFASNIASEPVFTVLGQRQDLRLADAQENNVFEDLDLADMFTPEVKLLYRVIFQSRNTYGNAVKARVVEVEDYRSVSNVPAGTYVPATFSSITGKLLTSQLTGAFQVNYAAPVAAAATTILAAKAANGNAAPGAQPIYPANVRCTLAGSGGSTDVVVTITGVLACGHDDVEEIAVLGGNGNYDGVKAWASITDIAYTGTWDGGNVTFLNGDKLGLPHMPLVSVYKEVFGGAAQALGTVDLINGTYIPTGAPNGATVLELWYRV
jgi:hypothetical protein